MNSTFIVVLVAVLVIAIVIIYGNRQKKWYKVIGVDGDVLIVYRTLRDYWLGENMKESVTAHYENGDTTFIPRHWVKRVDRIREGDLDRVKAELKALQDKTTKDSDV